MSDYKNTLNLPQTDFPMKANLAEREPLVLKKWAENKLYSNLRAARFEKKKFILHMGPPYANGHIHLGTATTTILKDMIVKAKSMSGFDAPLVPGWDCHGLPIELNVEKKVGKPGHKISATAFREACRDYANSFINIQRDEFKRLGIVADWDHPYLTMDFKYEANIIRSLAKIIRNQHVEKGYKPVHWCLDCGSALAEAEVEYADKTSPAIDVRFTVVTAEDFYARFETVKKGEGFISIPIWTTTPWSLPANQAVALNTDFTYVLVQVADEQLLLAEELVADAMKRYGSDNYQILAKIKGETLSGVLLQHPFYDKNVPVILSDHVTIESGTGAVHIAPVHGTDDYQLGKKYQLSLENPIADDGCYTEKTLLFASMHVNKANDSILEALRSRNKLLHLENIRHSYPHCWRHKSPIIFRATPQWFISMEKKGLREMALKAIDCVEWVPDWGKPRIVSMISNRPDWCISRQRSWGVPLSLFIHKQTGELHPDTEKLMEQVALLVEERGIEAWYDLDMEALLGADAKNYQKAQDILDVWFDSGVSHECVLKVRPDLAFPADLVLEGSDQHRGWFQSSLLTSLAINDSASYKIVLTHGFVVDGQGRKMSKSLGNVIAPEEVIKTMGADVLRLWVASIDYRYEISASKEILSRTSEAYRRIRNTARFLLANLHDFDPQINKIADNELLALDRFAVVAMQTLQRDVIAAYDAFEFHIVVQKVHQFCVNELGSFYLDIIKDRQYTMAKNSHGRRSAQTALYHIAHALVRILAPILSFTAEEIWQYLPGITHSSVMLETWYDTINGFTLDVKMNDQYWQKVRLVREAVNKEIEGLRNDNKIGSALEACVALYCDESLFQTLSILQNELRFVLITSAAKVFKAQEASADVVLTEVPGLSLKIIATKALKCERCWHRREDVNANAQYPGLCGRCVENVAGKGEERHYA